MFSVESSQPEAPENTSTQAVAEDQTPSDPQISPTKGRLKAEKKLYQNRYYRLKKSLTTPPRTRPNKKISSKTKQERLVTELSEYLPEAALDFVATRIRMGKKRRTRWSDKDKCVALSLYHISPKAYQLVKKIFALPSISTLRRAVSKVRVYPGFNKKILEALKSKVEGMPAGSELCALVFDEMTIKETVVYNAERDEIEGLEDYGMLGKTHFVANHATVFMLRGLLSKWKQPIGYFLSSGPIDSRRLHTLLLEALDQVKETGLLVKVIIADQGSNNRCVLEKHCKVTIDNPCFTHNGSSIFVMYDPPHLLKNIRNNLKKSGFRMNNKEIKWSYIEQFFEFDKKCGVRMAPKLTSKHIHLPPFAGLRVKYATQILSHSVAAGLSFMVAAKLLPEEAQETALFLENFDQLFNAFNSGLTHSPQRMRHALSDTSGHIKFLEEMKIWLGVLQSQLPRSLPCVAGWLMTCNSLLSLWADLSRNCDVKFLFTNRLNQDCLENLFSVIRGKGGHRDNPSAQELRAGLRASMVDAIIVQSSNSNCLQDTDKFLLTLTSLTERDDQTPRPAPALQMDEDTYSVWLLSQPPTPVPDFHVQEAQKNILFYIAGWVADKLKEKVCSDCQDKLVGQLSGAPHEKFLTLKQYASLEEGLTVPSTQLFGMTIELESIFVANIEHILHMDKVAGRLMTQFENKLEQVFTCSLDKPCTVDKKVRRLFFNMRLNFALKEFTRSLANQSARRNRKVMKLTHL